MSGHSASESLDFKTDPKLKSIVNTTEKIRHVKKCIREYIQASLKVTTSLQGYGATQKAWGESLARLSMYHSDDLGTGLGKLGAQQTLLIERIDAVVRSFQIDLTSQLDHSADGRGVDAFLSEFKDNRIRLSNELKKSSANAKKSSKKGDAALVQSMKEYNTKCDEISHFKSDSLRKILLIERAIFGDVLKCTGKVVRTMADLGRFMANIESDFKSVEHLLETLDTLSDSQIELLQNKSEHQDGSFQRTEILDNSASFDMTDSDAGQHLGFGHVGYENDISNGLPPPPSGIPVNIPPPPSGIPGGIPPPPSGIPGGIPPPPSGIPGGIPPPPSGIPGGIPPPPSGIPVSIPPPPSGIPVSIPPPPSGIPGGMPPPPSGIPGGPSPPPGIPGSMQSPHSSVSRGPPPPSGIPGGPPPPSSVPGGPPPPSGIPGGPRPAGFAGGPPPPSGIPGGPRPPPTGIPGGPRPPPTGIPGGPRPPTGIPSGPLLPSGFAGGGPPPPSFAKGPPAPPPSSVAKKNPPGGAPSSGDNRGALLDNICGFKGGLKKTQTNDRSAPIR